MNDMIKHRQSDVTRVEQDKQRDDKPLVELIMMKQTTCSKRHETCIKGICRMKTIYVMVVHIFIKKSCFVFVIGYIEGV